ncbi:glycine cleavage system aminomethyltransferase GcvT [Kaistia geumhonensis]|uniref:aminomethyltransferase n=1 Tax=Kaistia geumhonensis TaxID=410839 RepID=A0ABU0MBC5_9HYPH|nr:glycine cleavage system aminomethyltransferase GcvT [Kaistia geumhonensis]MCX5481199.1 glycine cleavage system aminomethyltransferase GcvT [Kaistia geumhonensis]MDQ0518260.1 aminomethyltransferase [Kaistia geumhonensis]
MADARESEAQNSAAADSLLETPLATLHRALGARMVPFAGYAMPVQYPAGILAEHNWTRESAGLFDVSHMGQAFLEGPDHATTARALEALTPGDFLNLAPGRIRYTLLTTAEGGIIDDLMVTRPAGADADGTLFLVVNAARKAIDYAHIAANLPDGVTLRPVEDRALLALQGPLAAAVLARHVPGAETMGFMTAADTAFDGIPVAISRSGYTGEDGYEISVAAAEAEAVARALLDEEEVKPIGLGARDSLRLEAGLCLYGHDIDEATSPAEADLGFAVPKRRRAEGGFPGAGRILAEFADGPARLRVGIQPDGRAPAREGTEIRDASGTLVGLVTSGGFGPTAGGPVAMGYVAADASEAGTPLTLSVRGKDLAARVVPLPFVPHRYFRKTSS